MFLNRMPPPNDTGSSWLAKISADPRMTGQEKALLIAQEIARVVRHDGSGEMGSPADLARPSGMKEDEAEAAVNALIIRGFVALIYRPRIRFATAFFVRPSPYQNERLMKAAGKGSPDAAR